MNENKEVIDGAIRTNPIKKNKFQSDIHSVDNQIDDKNNNIRLIRNSSFELNLDKSTYSTSALFNPKAFEKKPILISYVRAEAENHARQLKSELIDLGCNVFLDIDEIEAGDDWQDVLNNAVLKCGLFVPLITPQYGYTLWTNREIKLADIKSKKIIPISFLDDWPPECLSIQFASTQYIPWKKDSDIIEIVEKGNKERARDIRFWDQSYVKTTAKAIADHFRNTEKRKSDPLFALDETTDHLSVLKPIRKIVNGKLVDVISKKKPISGSRPKNIVISAHLEQIEFVTMIRKELNKFGFNVWSDAQIENPGLKTLEYDYNDDDQTIPTPNRKICGSERKSDETLSDIEIQSQSQNLESNQESQPIPPNESLLTGIFSLLSISSNEDIKNAENFRHRTEAADVVIIVLSKSYCNSRTCKEQAFYCESRKKVIPIKYDDKQIPHWMSMLIEYQDVMEYNSEEKISFFVELINKVSEFTSSSEDSFECTKYEKRIHSLISDIGRHLPLKEKENILVYITGSDQFFNPLSESICRAIGHSLASIPFLVLVTGSYAVAETIGRSFCEGRELLFNEKPANLYYFSPHCISQDSTFKTHRIPGHSLFIGDSFKKRDSVIARMIDYCILIEGGPRSATIAEEFLWNDNFIIPILCTGDTGVINFDLLEKLQNVPLGVDKDDWSTLFRNDVTAENIAESVKNIICSLVMFRSRKNSRELCCKSLDLKS